MQKVEIKLYYFILYIIYYIILYYITKKDVK